MTDVYIHISSEDARDIARPLAEACARAGISWCCFFTNDGVKALADASFAQALAPADRAVACEASWHQFMGEAACPVELGSQTTNSELMALAERVISL